MQGSNTCTARCLMLACLALGLALCGSAAIAGPNLARTGAATASSFFSNDYLPRFANDGNLATRFSAGAGDSDQWYQIEWNTPQTFNAVAVTYFAGYHYESQLTVQVWNSATSTWTTVATVGDGTSVLPIRTGATFATVTSKKVRISKVVTFYEFEVYNDTNTGQVLATPSGKPVVGARVDAGADASTTDAGGYYHLNLAPGTYPVKVSRYYQYDATQSVTSTAGSVTTTDLHLASANLAPLGTASADSVYAGYPASNLNDDDRNSQWSKTPGEPNCPVYIEWATPQTFDSIVLRFLPSWHTETFVHVDVWDENASDWVEIATAGDPEGFILLPFVTQITFAPQTTTKLRVHDLETFNELEVYNGLADINGNVLDNGMPVGCVTVQGGLDNYTTQDSGVYTLTAPIGSVTLRASAASYDNLVVSNTLTSDGLWQDLELTRTAGNLAMETGVAVTASSEDLGFEAALAVDGFPCTAWQVPAGTVDGWITLEWTSAKTVDTVIVKGGGFLQDAAVDAWIGGEWVQMGLFAGATASFTPVSTTKLRVRHIGGAPEVEVYNLNGAAPAITLQSTVTNGDTGAPLAGAVVSAGGKTATTGASGKYYLALPEGDVTVTASHMNYPSANKNVYVPPSGFITADFALTNTNVAPLATATASTEHASYPASAANDDNPLTRWSATDRVSTIVLEWPSAVTINRVKVHQCSDPYGAWGITSLRVDYWNGTAWKQAGTLSGLTPPVPATVDMPIALSVTNKIKLTGTISIYEVEVLTAPDVIPGTIADVKDLPDGSTVQVTGVVTAVFPDFGMGYLESTDRVAALRVEPLDKLGYIVDLGDNFALTGTASAQDFYGPGYEPSLVADGNINTYWSAADRGRWLQIDWPGDPKTFNTVIVYNVDSSWNSPTLTVSVRDSGGTWTQVASAANGPNKAVFTFPSVTAEAVQITGLTAVREAEVRNVVTDASGVLTNQEVTILGTLSTSGKERLLLAGTVLPGSPNPLGSLAMPGKSFSLNSEKPSTICMLTTTWGRVTAMTSAGEGKNYLYIDDGSGLPSDTSNTKGIKVGPLVTDVFPGQFVQVTGIASAGNNGITDFVTILPRSDAEVIKHSQIGPNLAPLGTVSAQSEFGAGYEATKLNDGNPASRWSGSVADQWVELDWAEPQTFNAVVLVYNDMLPYNQPTPILQRWDDAQQAFVDVMSLTADKAVLTFSFPQITTSKIRVLHVTTFYEMEVRMVL